MPEEEIQRFFAGQQIFAEGERGDKSYIVLSGNVEVFCVRDGKRVTIANLGAGSSLGEMAAISGETRSTSALAVEPSELRVISADRLRASLENCDLLTRAIMDSLIERLREETRSTIGSATALNPVVATSMILALEGKLQLSQRLAANKGSGGPGRGAAGASAGGDTVELSLARAARQISELLGYPRAQMRSTFKTMAGMNLLSIQPPQHEPKIQFRPGDIVRNAENICRSFGDMVEQRLKVDAEYLDIDDLAENFGVNRAKLYRKIMRADFPDDLIVFRKREAQEAFEVHGRPYFEELRPKDPALFDHINDIEHVPLDIIRQEAARFEPYSLSVLIKFQSEEETRKRLLASLSTNMRSVIEKTLKTIPASEADQAVQIGNDLIERLKTTLLAQKQADTP